MRDAELRTEALGPPRASHSTVTILSPWMRACLLLLLMCWGMLGAVGCGSICVWRGRDPVLSQMDPPLAATCTSEEILARVNRNAYSEYSPEGLKSYRCDDVDVRMKGVPAKMRASIVVEAPRNLRLRVANPLSGGEAVDIGSNEQEFWFWAKDSKPANVLVCAHDQIAVATQVTSLPLPFRPDWLMEVLGVAPISGTGYEVRRTDRKSPIVELVSEQRTPDQQPVRRIVKVDMRYGVVLEHRIESTSGELIAKATLSRHFRDPGTRLILPRVIAIDWPAAGQQLSLSLEFKTVDFNSPSESDAMWQSPEVPGYPEFDLGEYALKQLGRPPADIASQSDPKTKGREEPGSATLDDLEVIEAPDGDESAAGESWTQDASLDPIDRSIRDVSVTSDAEVLPAPETELPVSTLDINAAPESPSTAARPFPE